MNVDVFAWAPSMPLGMWDDKEWAYQVLQDEWIERLRAAGGRRLPGPINVRVMHFGYIDDDSLEEVIMCNDGPGITYVVVRVTGPAMSP